jgi:hypothetical protein
MGSRVQLDTSSNGMMTAGLAPEHRGRHTACSRQRCIRRFAGKCSPSIRLLPCNRLEWAGPSWSRQPQRTFEGCFRRPRGPAGIPGSRRHEHGDETWGGDRPSVARRRPHQETDPRDQHTPANRRGAPVYGLQDGEVRREVSLPDLAVTVLRAAQKDQAECRLLLGEAWQELDLVVERGDGGAVEPIPSPTRFSGSEGKWASEPAPV